MTRYFSALSNEANLRDVRTALLIFGVTDSGEVCGTNYRSGSPEKLQSLKREIAGKTNQQMTFREITELDIDGKRVVVFQIPPALNGAPTTWEGVAWGRDGSSLVPLSLDKIDAIRAKPRTEWGREILERATIEDLDPDAVEQAIRAFRTRFYQARPALLDGLSTYDLLEKMGLTRGGMLTNASLLLLGRSGAEEYLDGPAPCLTWTLYGDGGQAVSYQHYGVPFILNVENVCHRVRNERIFMRSAGSSAVVQPISQYEWWSMRELLGNAIAHQDYGVSRHIYLHEFPNKLVFLNEGGFIPGSIEAVLREGYRAPRYRNPFLCDALMKLGILDRNTLGIRRVFEAQKDRRMPLPTYDLSDPGRVSVTLWGSSGPPIYERAC